MKKLRLLIFTILLIHFYSNGQFIAPYGGVQQRVKNLNYDAILDTSKLWSVCIQYANIQYSIYYKISDTITIDENLYNKVYETNDSLLLAWNFSGYIRENESSEVYFRNTNGDEGLIYKFDLEVNDSVEIYNPLVCPEYQTLVVSDIDSVLLGNMFRKRIYFFNSNNEDFWTEGIGSKLGLLFSNYCYIGALYNLLCYYESDSLVYQNPGYNNCYYPLINNINLNKHSESFQVIYNPDGQTISVSISNLERSNEAFSLRIFDLLGNEVFHCNLFDNTQIISTSHFATGIYLVNIISPSNRIYQSKILIY